MASSVIFLVLLQLCGLQLMLVAMPTCRMRENLVRTSHHLLRDLGGPFPVHCLQYNVNISFPDSALPATSANQAQCRRALWVVYETLNETQLILQNNHLPVGGGGVTWDEGKLDTFMNLQERLLEEGSCLSTGPHAVSSYFSNVTAVLQHKESAACGWMALRRDVLRVLKIVLHKHHNCFL
nr:interferon beta-like [Solea senegalensis]